MIQITDSLIKNIWNSYQSIHSDMNKRFNYYNGNHNFLKTNSIRGKDKSNCATNFIDTIIDSHVNLSTGIPYEIVLNNPVPNIVDQLNFITQNNNLNYVDTEHFLNSMIAGYSVEVHSFDNGINITCYDPREFAFIFEHDGKTINVAIHKSILPINSVYNDRLVTSQEFIYTIYTKTEIITYHVQNNVYNIIDKQQHFYNSVPIVIFSLNNKKRPFLSDNLINQNDTYNRIDNNRIDELEYKNAILAAVGFGNDEQHIKQLSKVQELGLITLPNDSDLKWISTSNETDKYTTAIENTKHNIYMQGKIPAREEIKNAIGSLSGQAIKHLYQPMLQQAKTFRNYISRGLHERINLINAIWSLAGYTIIKDYTIQFSDNLPIDIKSIIEENSLMKDYMPIKTLIQRIPGIDTNQALEQLQQQNLPVNVVPTNSNNVPNNSNPVPIDIDNDQNQATRIKNREKVISFSEEDFTKKIADVLNEKRKQLKEINNV